MQFKEEVLQAGQECSRTFAELSIDTRVESDEVWFAYTLPNEYQNVLAARQAPWSRYIGVNVPVTLEFSPKLPDRPVLLALKEECKVLPSSRVNVYAFIPLFIKCSLNKQQIAEAPTKILSDTWFGEPHSGELCYNVASELHQKLPAFVDFPSHTVACPIRIRNRSEEELIIKTLCLRVQWLSIYSQNSHLISNETLITYRGLEQPSEIHVAASGPNAATLLSGSRSPAPRSLSIRSFVSMLGLK